MAAADGGRAGVGGVWPAAVRAKDSGSACQRVGVSVARGSKPGEPCFT
jgi:hypothetical protein